MTTHFEKVKEYLMELNYSIVKEDKTDEVFIVEQELDGIKNLVIGCADPILIMEQFIFKVSGESSAIFKDLLQKNRDIVHGAFVLDDNGHILFRDTLQLENLDLNELEGSLNSLSLLLSEFSDDIIAYSKN